MAGSKKKIIYDPETGEITETPGSGRPRKHPPRQPPKERPEGVEFRDRTGRRNPGAFAKKPEKSSENAQNSALEMHGLKVAGKKMKSQEFRELCMSNAEEAFGLLWADTISDDIAPRDRLNNVKFITAYAYGNPHTSVDVNVNAGGPDMNSLVALIERKRREKAASLTVGVSPVVDVEFSPVVEPRGEGQEKD